MHATIHDDDEGPQAPSSSVAYIIWDEFMQTCEGACKVGQHHGYAVLFHDGDIDLLNLSLCLLLGVIFAGVLGCESVFGGAIECSGC